MTSPVPPQLPSGGTADHNLAYVANGRERQKLDLYLPSQDDDHPRFVWIHGGALGMGSKEGSTRL